MARRPHRKGGSSRTLLSKVSYAMGVGAVLLAFSMSITLAQRNKTPGQRFKTNEHEGRIPHDTQ